MKLESSPGFLKNPGSDSGLAFGGVEGCWGGGGDDDDSVTQTHKQYHHKSRFARYLQYFRDVGPSHIVTNCTLDFANWTWALRGLSAKTRNWLGGSLFFTRYLKYLGHVVVHCCPPFFSSIVAFGRGAGWGGA